MRLKNIIICLFVITAILVAFFIFKLSSSGKTDLIKTAFTNSVVVDIYQGYKGKPNYQIMKLSDSQHFTIPKQMLGLLKIGDSVYKTPNSSFYFLP